MIEITITACNRMSFLKSGHAARSYNYKLYCIPGFIYDGNQRNGPDFVS